MSAQEHKLKAEQDTTEDETIVDVTPPTEELTALQKRANDIAKQYEDLSLDDKISIIAQAFGANFGTIETRPCTGDWCGTSDVSIRFDNGHSFSIGNRVTPKAKTQKAQHEMLNSKLVLYNPQIVAVTKENAIAFLREHEAKDNKIALEKGLKPYRLLNVEFYDGTEGKDDGDMGWYYVTLAVDGKIFPLMETNLNHEIIIVDGHNRYKLLCLHPEIKYSVHKKDFANEHEAIVWICKNQLGRRNLTPQQKKYLIGHQYEAKKKAHGASDGFRGNRHTAVVSDNFCHLQEQSKTRSIVAEESNVNEGYVQNAYNYAKGVYAAEEVMPGIKLELLSGSIKPPEKDVVAIAKAPLQERQTLIEKLCTPREPPEPNACLQPKKLNRADMKLVREENEKMRNSDVRPTGKSMLCEVEDAKDGFISRWSGVFHHSPDLLTDTENKAFVCKNAKELATYLNDVIKATEQEECV